jgi:hypothetical protein
LQKHIQVSGDVYIIGTDPSDSDTYNKLLGNVPLIGSEDVGFHQLAISADGKHLFATQSTQPSDLNHVSRIIVINIDLSNPTHNNVIARIDVPERVFGINATDDPKKMTVTFRRSHSNQGSYAVLNINNNSSTNSFEAVLSNPLTLGIGNGADLFFVKDPWEAEVYKSSTGASYGFVVGAGGLPLPGIDLSQPDALATVDALFSTNIGILKNPLGDSPELVAATLQIPYGFGTSITISGDYLYASFAGKPPEGSKSGFVAVYDIKEIIKTINDPANKELLLNEPIESINSNILIEGYTPLEEARKTAKVLRDRIANLRKKEQASQDELDEITNILIGLGLVAAAAPFAILAWDYTTETRTDIDDLVLYISTFPQGEGLLPGDDKFVSKDANLFLPEDKLYSITADGVKDYNPNRVLVARAKKPKNGEPIKWNVQVGTGEVKEINLGSHNNIFPVGDYLNLTGGQKYYWALQSKDSDGKIQTKTSEFYWPQSKGITDLAKTYKSVTFLTHDSNSYNKDGYKAAKEIALEIAKNNNDEDPDGTVLQYSPVSGEWKVIYGDKNYKTSGLGKPLVLIADWQQDSADINNNAGFTEGAADSLFASLVDLNLDIGKDKFFKSPFHFIGFGRGAVVNDEIIQRIGTYFPKPKNSFSSNDPNYVNKDMFGSAQNFV